MCIKIILLYKRIALTELLQKEAYKVLTYMKHLMAVIMKDFFFALCPGIRPMMSRAHALKDLVIE